MNKAKGHILTGALVLGVILLGAQTGFTQVAGRVAASGGGAVDNATVQVWDTYPGGMILGTTTTTVSGEFAFTPSGATQVDLRVIKGDYFPTVVRALPDPTTNTLVEIVRVLEPVLSPVFAAYWGQSTPFLNSNILLGDIVESRDTDGIVTGVSQHIEPGGVYLLYAYGDVPGLDGIDEGMQQGEIVSFLINGLDATVDGTPTTFAGSMMGGGGQVQLIGATQTPGATVTGFLDKDGEAGTSAHVTFTLTNTGGTTETFTVSAENDQGWTMVITPTKSESVPLNPGQSSAIVVEVQIPPGTLPQIVEVRLMAVADSYGSANSGAFTNLNVTVVSDIWDGQGGSLLPSGFALAQNYPNPFNPSTLISFNLEYAGHVQLEVVNLLGQRVRTLVSGYRSAGVNSEIWDGRDQNGITVPSGVYFYRLAQDGLTQTRKMVLLK